MIFLLAPAASVAKGFAHGSPVVWCVSLGMLWLSTEVTPRLLFLVFGSSSDAVNIDIFSCQITGLVPASLLCLDIVH